MIRHVILAAALLLSAPAVAQNQQEAAHRDLWCGLAFDYAAGELPSDATRQQQQVIPHYRDGARMLVDRAEQRYLAAGYSIARFAALREELTAAVAEGLAAGGSLPYSFQDCAALLPR
jgi:anti-sigma-K factor RskA